MSLTTDANSSLDGKVLQCPRRRPLEQATPASDLYHDHRVHGQRSPTKNKFRGDVLPWSGRGAWQHQWTSRWPSLDLPDVNQGIAVRSSAQSACPWRVMVLRCDGPRHGHARQGFTTLLRGERALLKQARFSRNQGYSSRLETHHRQSRCGGDRPPLRGDIVGDAARGGGKGRAARITWRLE